MKTRIFALLLCLLLLFTGCKKNGENEGYQNPEEQGPTADLGDDNTSFGEPLNDLGAYEGYFEGESTAITVTCVSGTQHAYKLEGTTLTFTAIGEESVYAISGTLKGNIVIDVGDGYKFDLELQGLSLVCDATNPITVVSGEEVAIKAKEDTKNYIYDKRAAIDSADEALYAGAIHSGVDLEIGGKGALTVISENNNGIHSKDDLQVKNLTLFTACIDNALKGNDSVEIIPWFIRLSYLEGGNTGMAFGLLADNALAGILLPLTAVLCGWLLMRHYRITRFTAAACGLVLGGFIGNFAERLLFGYVRDMIFLPWLPWFVCNVADIFICFGVALLAFSLLLRPQDWEERGKADADH